MAKSVNVAKPPKSLKSLPNNLDIKSFVKNNHPSLFKTVLKAVFAIFFIGAIYVLIKIYQSWGTLSEKSEEIKSNWPKYRCDPKVMPFASQLTGGKVGTLANSLECLMMFFNNAISKFLEPIYAFFEKIINVIFDLVKSVQNIRKMLNYLRDSINAFLHDIASMLYGYAKKLSYLQNRLMDTFSKIFRVYENLFYALGYSAYMAASTWNGPVGGVARFFGICFPPNTPVQMNNGEQKLISDINAGDHIYKGGKVLAVYKFSGKNTPLYLYKNKTIVSGHHLVFENRNCVRVCDSQFSERINKQEDIIYCLTTEKGKIVINDELFADYMEVENDEQTKKVMEMVIRKINCNEIKTEKIKTEKIKAEKVWGFHEDTFIKLGSGENRKIKDIVLGDNLGKNNVVTGITKVCGKNIELFEYDGITLSGNVLVKHNGKWNFARDIANPLRYENLGKSNLKSNLYHIFTSNGEMIVNNTLFKDCEQTNDDEINRQINEYVENSLVKKKM